ncbi:adenosine deaminase [Nisaea acidiphila]|uniref:adenosine deaminase n=1 Tax=Nisaea acidiphila TaxID=1862145 RepID=A0A9J7AW44_9PROT|nr:adenosine deaminase [Nisaea acidiphila]UUX51528.1 adenosine deaminase [Nisaea acidiphila]
MRVALIVGVLALSLGACAGLPDGSPEARTAAHFEAIRGDRTLTRAFLQAMPKGADLHTHLSGAVYAEAYIDWAADPDIDLCFDPAKRAIVACAAHVPPVAKPDCREAVQVRMSDAAASDACRAAITDNLSMRNFRPNPLWEERSGHDQFFATFARFGAISGERKAESLAWLARNAALQNIVYVEPMMTLGWVNPAALGVTQKLKGGSDAELAAFEKALLDNGFGKLVDAGAKVLNDAMAGARAEMGCGGTAPEPGCAVTLRQLGQSIRTQPPEHAFAQIMLHYMIADREKLSVGVNFVAPEDYHVALRDYSLHMAIFGYFKRKYERVGLSLHAGELWLGVTELEDMTFHIREAVEIAGVNRIGHGVAIGFEHGSEDLIARMAKDGIAVEINLSSNEQILGVKGKDHPFPTYLRAGVPVMLSTDDEGVERIDLSSQYQLASERYGLNYAELKQLSRQSLEQSFLTGASLWYAFNIAQPVGPCSSGFDTADCKAFIARSDKARAQVELEKRFAAFEGRW